MICMLVLGVVVFGWWALRDSRRMGYELGRLEERRAWLEREYARDLASRGEHLRLVRGSGR